ncbi:PH domain-containing protein [Streptomyces sp. SID12501]|uniref:PH domain-containing protein n=1 Tax=Streptomyces sp. SID12501 TaxID=2706042 RepID=A0A6B3C3R9_9ACTN|nr:PH domain-containing protein [Streptomyces sp. SID12501]NEC91461.1 PH domain-containing protein [Streptomyces sp. SID12501]
MTTPDHPSPVQGPTQPESPDRVYRSPSALVAGVLLLGIAAWLGGDALFAGHGRTPWLALATLLLVVPLVIAFTLRPVVLANDHRLRVRNPFRIVVLPWGAVAGFRSGFSNEVVVGSGAKYQLWAVPVSLRARKRANRAMMRQTREAGGTAGRTPLVPSGPTRAQTDQIMDDLGRLREAREEAATSQGEVTVKWAYEIMAPAAAGAVLLAILLAVG